jgi:GrpB-like predicted nucleotidyltransferase (UPF0157 family)
MNDSTKKITYSIENYNPEWPNLFSVIKNELEKIFNKKAIKIEHIGSTSIIEMKAKPVIDVLIVVENVNDLSKELGKMKSLGYIIHENLIDVNSFLCEKKIEDRKIENIHIFQEGSAHIDRLLNTRDFLRTHPTRVKQYNDLKDKLYIQFPTDYEAYKQAKRDFMEKTFELTKDWKTAKSA